MGERAAATRSNELIVLSSSAEGYFKQEYGREATLIHNGVEIRKRVDPSLIIDRWGLTRGDYILYLGRLVPEKRGDLLVDAFRQLVTDKRLVIAGGGSDTETFESELRKRAGSDPRILFTGFVTGEVLAELYSNAYAYVLPSDVEGMPLSLLEAMSYGACCVTSDVPECADVLADAGVTFGKGDVSELAHVLSSLLDNPEKANKLGESARERVRNNYDWDSVVERTLELYQGEAR